MSAMPAEAISAEAVPVEGVPAEAESARNSAARGRLRATAGQPTAASRPTVEGLRSVGLRSRPAGQRARSVALRARPTAVRACSSVNASLWSSALAQPSATQPAGAPAALAQSALLQPVIVPPAGVEPATIEPAVIAPVIVERARVEPVVEQVIVRPIVDRPAVTERGVVRPAVAQPSVRPQRVTTPALAASRAPQSAPSQLRLTRRGRLTLAVGTAVIAGVLCFLAVNSAQAADRGAGAPPAAAHSMSQIIVQPGQTLWSIAEQADPTADTRLVVQQIVTDNSLSSETVAAGQHLSVPQS